MQNAMKEHGNRTKIALARASTKAAETAENMEGADILDYAGKLKDVATIAEKVHGWNEGKSGNTTVNILSQNTAIWADS